MVDEKKKVGRPSNEELGKTKELTKREQSAAMKEFRQRLLLHPKSPALVEKMFSLALDDEAKNQGIALKLLADRILPVAGFTHDNKQQSQVSINITGIGTDPVHGVTISGTDGEIEDADYDE
jgi:hypothetical protein